MSADAPSPEPPPDSEPAADPTVEGGSDGPRPTATLIEKIRLLPRSPGVYLFKDARGRVLYIGKAKDLRSRVSSYFQASADLLRTRGPEIAAMIAQATDLDFLDCETEVDALLQENRLIKDIQPPYNERLRDDKSFPYIEITTAEDFPGVYVTRKPQARGTRLYGPFVSASGVRAAVNALQKVFRFRTCELEIREGDDSRRHFRPCLLYSIHQCTAPCAALISRADYRRDIARLRRFLSSKRSVVLRQLRREMEAAAAGLHYEEAARLRDRIRALEALSLSGDVETDVQPEVFFVDPAEGLARLAEILGMESPPRTIEGVDIANLHGQESCGSLVCFIDGRPFKSGYRRFRIRTVQGIDDYAMIREVVARRYRRAAGGEELYPDVILIDGGLGHLHAALSAFEDMQVRPPMVVSLAKREEELYVQARGRPLRLPRNNPALRLLQQVRDEAHRFAQHYHHLLRRRRMFDQDLAEGRVPPPGRGARGRRGKTPPTDLPAAMPGPIDPDPPDPVDPPHTD